MCIQSVLAAGGLGEADDPVITSTPLVKQAIAVKANGTHTLFLFFLHSATVSLFFLPQPVALVIFYSLLLVYLFYFFKQDQQPQSARLGFGRQRVS